MTITYGSLPVMKHPAPPKPQPTRSDSIAPLLSGQRTFVPIRSAIAQSGRGKQAVPGRVLPGLVLAGDATIEQYLLTHAAASNGAPYVLKQPPSRLARAAGRTEGAAGLRATNRAWARLEALKLVRTTPGSRPLEVLLLKEDGSGQDYVRPSLPGNPKERFFKLPHEYWLGEWNTKLTVPAKIMLLVALTLDDYFWLPREYGPSWYGLSPSTVQRGLAKLVQKDALEVFPYWRATPHGPREYVQMYRYKLRPPFAASSGRIARGAVSDLAHLELEARETTKKTAVA